MKYLSVIPLIISTCCFGGSEIEPVDISNKKYADYACDQMGADCKKFTRACEPPNSSMPNTCIALTYFKLEVAKELCGIEKYVECFESNNEYLARWMHELNLPNVGNPKREIAFEKCSNIGMYDVKSSELKKFEVEVLKVFQKIREPIDIKSPSYQKQKDFYLCFEKHLK
ncbi:hypothetical protein JF50_19065 [Pseudoalteromonas luteoviolacea]|uniref:Uncharacterized protein n=1 Tax=Pseudoalteromonas luteoviolacea TaxID=43657 RepID=A0A0C1QA86_9GAMM|nr:hypothetical protein [Pseudoalteromonas luteoviolacea]KID56340.1 hypothetical protein JF50_19065 [Pseudoalteromonas luteoviolacea]